MSMKPNRLKIGDTIGIIAPASPPGQENLERAYSFLEELGLKIKVGSNTGKINGYLAGTDAERLADLHEMFADPGVNGIICACGGYGTARLASAIDYEVIKQNPKIFWGYSDITFLHNAFHQRTGLVTFHGPMLASDIGKDDVDPLSKEYFQQLFEKQTIRYSEDIAPLEVLIEGTAEGILVGGNLSLLASSLGTPFELDTKESILLIEDVHEEPRAVDRMLNQLYLAGKLTDANAIMVGDFRDCVPKRGLSLELDEVIGHYIALANKPAMTGFKIGHCNPHISIPLGTSAKFDTKSKSVVVDSGVR